MNSRQFGCLDCQQYIDAGYRWCYTYLEMTGDVHAGTPVEVDRVLAATSYWTVDDSPESQWLRELLPKVRSFLLLHRTHRLHFGEIGNDHFFSDFDDIDWDEVGSDDPLCMSPATLFDVHHCRAWSDVEAYMQSRVRPVYWWGQPEIVEQAKVRFARLVKSRQPIIHRPEHSESKDTPAERIGTQSGGVSRGQARR